MVTSFLSLFYIYCNNIKISHKSLTYLIIISKFCLKYIHTYIYIYLYIYIDN
ncbi:hypothetical protein ACMBCN_00965 [Candidatus Liberibacter asiaticus]